jgi:hypothetical protein
MNLVRTKSTTTNIIALLKGFYILEQNLSSSVQKIQGVNLLPWSAYFKKNVYLMNSTNHINRLKPLITLSLPFPIFGTKYADNGPLKKTAPEFKEIGI